MSTFFLRSLVHQGFCGQYQDVHADRGLGYVQAALDRIIDREMLSELDDESLRTQLALRYEIPYEHRITFDRCLRGLIERRHEFEGDEIKAREVEHHLPGDSVQYVKILRGSALTVEPMYTFYPLDAYLPMHALAIAHLEGRDSVHVRSVSVVGDTVIEQTYPVHHEKISELIQRALTSQLSPGPQCASCRKTDCPSAADFERLVLEWMKAKQTFEESQERVRQHLIAHGPTKCGAHIIYLTEHLRRFYKDKDVLRIYGRLVEQAPKDYVKYLNPDSAEIARAVGKGELPKDFMDFFTTSRYYTIESNVSL